MTTDCSRCGTAAQEGDERCRACGAPVRPLPTIARAAPETSAVATVAHAAEPPALAPAASPAPTPVAASAPRQAAPIAPATQASAAPQPHYPSPYGAYPLSPLQVPYAWAGMPTAYAGYAPVAYQGYPGYPPYTYYPPRPRAAPGDGYRVFLGWFVTVGSGLTLLGGLLFTLLSALAVARGAGGLATVGSAIGITIVPVAGGAVGVYLGIRALLKRPSLRFTLPRWWVLAAITVLALAGEVVIWNLSPVPGSIWAVLPLFTLCGLLPALAILAYANGRLANPSTWRHVLVSLIYGAAVATFIASILNVAAYFVVVLILQSFGVQITFDLNFIQDLNPANPNQALAFFLIGSVAAPIIEETTKPIAAILAIPRLRSAGEAFLVGMAAGIGFAVVETLQYFGMGQADWVSIAIERVGAGLLHGVGAGMTAMGWYLLIRGKGVRWRWIKGFGAILYAIFQHAFFNGSNLLTGLPGINQLSQNSIPLGRLPLSAGLVIVFVIYALIVVVLTYITARLRKGVLLSEREPDHLASGPGLVATAPLRPQGGAR